MSFIDPPYNVDYEGTAGKIQNDKQTDEDFYNFLLSAFSNIYDSMRTWKALFIVAMQIRKD